MTEKILFHIKRYIPRRLFRALRPAYHFFFAWWAAFTYGFPSRHMTVIGVTGTKGKTTVVELLHALLEASGVKVASSSSLRFRIGEREVRNEKKMTMPGRLFVQRFLYDAFRAGCAYVVIEVPSEGIAQFRHRFIDFDIAVMTNVAPEHIESHGSFERYLRAKLDLFWRLPKEGIAVVNRDDPFFERFLAATPAHVVSYSRAGIQRNGSVLPVRDLALTEDRIRFSLGSAEMDSPLVGEFNFMNILAATAVAMSQHVALEKIAAGISRVSGVPGRMEMIQREPFRVVVDYAHTPDSLKAVYKTVIEFNELRSSHTHQLINSSTHKLICVLGAAGGGRDTWKRPVMGKIAAEFCNEIILTDEDPYDENPAAIIDDIEAGFSQTLNPKPKTLNPRKILDRREAIRAALRNAKEGDTVVITGKGAEPWMMGPNGTKIPWDDRAVTREEAALLRDESR